MPKDANIAVSRVSKPEKNGIEVPIRNARIIFFVSPESESFNSSFVKAMVDLLDRILDSMTCTVEVVVAGYLQRFNYYNIRFEEADEAQHLVAEKRAIDLEERWIKENSSTLSMLKVPYKIMRWKEILTSASYKIAAEKIKHRLGTKEFSKPIMDTAAIFYNSQNSKKARAKITEQQHEVFISNSTGHYLPEECVFLYSLNGSLQCETTDAAVIQSKQTTYVGYSHDPSPALKASIIGTDVRWLTMTTSFSQKKSREDIIEFLKQNPACGCSLIVDKELRRRAGEIDVAELRAHLQQEASHLTELTEQLETFGLWSKKQPKADLQPLFSALKNGIALLDDMSRVTETDYIYSDSEESKTDDDEAGSNAVISV